MTFRDYIGIPYKHKGRSRKGVDCYGLVVLIYREHLGIELPDAEYATWKVADEYLNAFYEESPHVVASYNTLWVPVTTPEKYDVILFNLFPDVEAPTHSGVYIGDGKLIHSMEELPVTIHRLKMWANSIHSMYRYKERASNG